MRGGRGNTTTSNVQYCLPATTTSTSTLTVACYNGGLIYNGGNEIGDKICNSGDEIGDEINNNDRNYNGGNQIYNDDNESVTRSTTRPSARRSLARRRKIQRCEAGGGGEAALVGLKFFSF